MGRNNIQRKKRKGNTRYSIIVDGETEVWYFQLMREIENLPYKVEPQIPKRKSLRELFDIVESHSNDYDFVFWIIDLDVVIKEHIETPKGKTSIVKELEEYIIRCEEISNVKIIINNPGLEYWFLLHFTKTNKYYKTCEEVIKALRKCKSLDHYEKSEKYYKSGTNIYQKLKDLQLTASRNAKDLGDFNIENLYCGKCNMHEIIEKLVGIEI